MLRKTKLLQDGSLWPRISFAEVGPRCAYCRSPHLARPVTLMSVLDPLEVTTLCFSCRLEAFDMGYQVMMPQVELS